MMARPVGILLALTIVAACGSNGTGPGSANGAAMTFKVGSQNTSVGNANVSSDGISWAIVGTNATLQSMSIAWEGNGTGTFTVGSGSEVNAVYSDGTNIWSAYHTQGSGSVTITSHSGNRVKGTFSFTMLDISRTNSINVTQGTFDVSY